MTALIAALQRGRAGRGAAHSYAALTSAMNAVGTIWIMALMALIVVDVAGRWLFNAPLPGVVLIVSHSIVGIVFLQLASTLDVGRLTRTSVFIGGLTNRKPFAASCYRFVFHALGAVVLGAIAWGSYPGLESAWITGEWVGTDTDVSFPIWPIRAMVVGGAAATALQFAILALRDAGTVVVRGGDAGRGKPLGLGAVAVLGVVLVALAAVAFFLGGDLSNLEIGIVSVFAMLILIYSGMHISVALISLSFAGMWVILGTPDFALRFLAQTSNVAVSEYIFGVVPLFVLTGLLVNGAEFGREAFEVAEWIFGKLRGGLGVATVAANAVFAAITGVSLASAAVFTRVAVPPMVERGYSAKFAVGIVAGSSVLGMLIPPSLLLILFGIIAEVSVAGLFLAAIIPGLILSTAFAIVIVIMTLVAPRFVGAGAAAGGRSGVDAPTMDVGEALIKLAPILILMLLVLGGIYGGVFTPTEAGAMGAFGALVIALVKRRLTWPMFKDIVLQTGHISTGVLFLILASKFFAQMLALSGLPAQVMGFVTGADLTFIGVIAGYMLVLLILGMILDPISILLITLPMILPIIVGLGGDLIWFGIVTIIAVEAGLLTPPLGLTVFVVQGILGDDEVSVPDVFRGSFPFVIAMLVVIALLVAVPGLTRVFL